MQKQPTRAALLNRVKILEAQLPCNLATASRELRRCGPDRFLASGLIVSITDLSGKQIVPPFQCTDGFEQATIDALQTQIKKTKDLQDISGVISCPQS